MKKKIITLLALALSTTLFLVGCGSKSNTLSEHLSSEKVIGYVTETVDKSKAPKNIYFFDNGKVTIIPGKKFGLTMGDFAKMSDRDIWNQLEEVKISYAENYVSEDMENNLKFVACREACEEQGHWLEAEYDILQELYTAYANNNITSDTIMWTTEYYIGTLYDVDMPRRNEIAENIIAQEGQDYTNAISTLKELAEIAKQKKEELSYKGPFFELPFEFSMETDATGNTVLGEALIYPTLEDSYTNENIKKYYNSLNFLADQTSDVEIYDTTYNCIGLSEGGSFLTREVLEPDTLNNKNINTDLTSEQMNELFKSEVMSRYN